MWEISNATQLHASFVAFLLGVSFSLFYDLIKATRKIGMKSYLLVFLSDIFFSLFAAIITFLFLLIFTNGALRGFVIIFELLGFVFCRLTVSRLFLKVFTLILFNLKKVFLLVSSLLFRFCEKIEHFLSKIRWIIEKTLKKCLKSVKKS